MATERARQNYREYIVMPLVERESWLWFLAMCYSRLKCEEWPEFKVQEHIDD